MKPRLWISEQSFASTNPRSRSTLAVFPCHLLEVLTTRWPAITNSGNRNASVSFVPKRETTQLYRGCSGDEVRLSLGSVSFPETLDRSDSPLELQALGISLTFSASTG
jgi:hypothetical protein